MTPDTPQKLEIDWLKTAGGVFAAVSSAFLLSTLGAAGTIIGAALGSVIVTVGGELYSQGLARSHQRLAQVQTAATRKAGVAQAEVRQATRHPGDGEVDPNLARAERRRDDVEDGLGTIADEPTGPGWRERLVMLPWKRISLITAGLFAAAVLTITAFELVAGQSVSSITGGTEGGGGPTIGRPGGGSDGDPSKEDNRPSPSTGEPTPTPESPTPAPTTSVTALPTDPATPAPTR